MKREPKVSVTPYLNTRLKARKGRLRVYFRVIYQRKMTRIRCEGKSMSYDEFQKADFSFEISQIEKGIRENGLEKWRDIQNKKKVQKRVLDRISLFPDEILKKEVLRRYNCNVDDFREEKLKEEAFNKSEVEIRGMMEEMQENLTQQISLEKRYKLLQKTINAYMKYI